MALCKQSEPGSFHLTPLVLVFMGYLKSGELSDYTEGTWMCFLRTGTHPTAPREHILQREQAGTESRTQPAELLKLIP